MTATTPAKIAFLLATALAASLAGACSGKKSASSSGPNVLFVLVDTLRKDRLHLYGYERRTSDRLEALSRAGWVFDNHVAHASQTVPSTLSIMLSRYPAEHGFSHRRPKQFGEERPVYPEEFRFLAEVFDGAGYETAAFVTNPFFGEQNGFNQGFDTFVFRQGKAPDEAEQIANLVIGWLEEHAASSGDPFFAYVHLMDVHQPYIHPEPYMQRFPAPAGGEVLRANGPVPDASTLDLECTSNAYDAGIPFVDDQVARIVDCLGQLGLRDNTIIVFTADHGEEFLEHGGLGHGTTVFGELVRVPLVIVYPAKLPPGRRIASLTEHVGLAPALLDLAGVERSGAFARKSLLDGAAAYAFTENGPWRAVYGGGKKLVLNTETGATTLFDMADELDQRPLPAETAPEELRMQLRRYLDLEAAVRAAGTAAAGSSSAWTEEELERLRSLGYAQ